VIVRQVSTHRSITPLPVTRSSRASSRASIGFTTIVLKNSLPARSFTLLTRVRWINRCPDRPERCLQTGKRCFTIRAARRDLRRAIRLPRSRHERNDFAIIAPRYTNSTIGVNVRFGNSSHIAAAQQSVQGGRLCGGAPRAASRPRAHEMLFAVGTVN
jgi:hypothetical protein